MDRSVVELQSFSPAQYDLVFYFQVIAAFALFASFLRSYSSRMEVSSKYRPAVLASMCITAVAAVSYLVLIVKWDSGFTLQDNLYVPNAEARLSVVPRYMDWSVTVPLLTVELLAVCAYVGTKARRTRAGAMTAAFLMILTGFIGAKVIDEGTNTGALWLWGLISTAFFVYLYFVLIFAVRDTMPHVARQTGRTLQVAATLLMTVWVTYPLVYAIPVFFEPTAKWTVGIQIAFSVADVIAKVGFGALIHKVAMLRTAEDVTAGSDTHPEPIWISQEQHSEGVQPSVKSVLHTGPVDGAHHHSNDGHRGDGDGDGDGRRPAPVTASARTRGSSPS